MLRVPLSIIVLIFAYNATCQNIGVGTNAPKSRLSVGANSQFQVDGLGDIRRINDIPYSFPVIQGTGGQVLMNDGTGQLNWASITQNSPLIPDSIIKITPANYLTVVVTDENYVKINGTLVISENYDRLNRRSLVVTGGDITGNGSAVVSFGAQTVFNGTRFTNVLINAVAPVFINCTFIGNCPRLGNFSQFINCQFSGVTTSFTNTVGVIENCNLQNCILPRASIISNSSLFSCTIGNEAMNQNSISSIINCNIGNSSIYALQAEFTFSDNKVSTSKVFLGNSNQAPSQAIISNNRFSGVLSGSSEAIEVSPVSNGYKMYSIQNNLFSMQPSDFSSIRISGTEGNPFGFSSISIQNNTFHRGSNTLFYSGNMRVNFSSNTINSAGGSSTLPGLSGNLQVSNNIVF